MGHSKFFLCSGTVHLPISGQPWEIAVKAVKSCQICTMFFFLVQEACAKYIFIRACWKDFISIHLILMLKFHIQRYRDDLMYKLYVNVKIFWWQKTRLNDTGTLEHSPWQHMDALCALCVVYALLLHSVNITSLQSLQQVWCLTESCMKSAGFFGIFPLFEW